MRGNKKISTLLLLLEHIIIDIMPFTVVTAVFILTFGYGLALLSDRTAGTGMYNAASVDGFLVKVYLTLLGEFQYEDDPTVAKLLVFVSFSFISNIVLLNALIAIITHSYDEGREHEAENRSLLLATVILETEANVERNEINFPSWVHVLRKNVEVGDFDGEPSSTTENLAFAVDSTHTSRRSCGGRAVSRVADGVVTRLMRHSLISQAATAAHLSTSRSRRMMVGRRCAPSCARSRPS